MEEAPKARVREQDAAWENAVLKAEPLRHRVKAVGEPAGVRAREPARAEAPDRVAAGSLNISTNQPFNESSAIEGGDLMPGYDRTGPMGAGPMTGGARGRCHPATGGTIPAYTGGYGRGLGLRRSFRGGYGPGGGRGCGYGRGYGSYSPAVGPAYSMDVAAEMDMLKAQADYMQKSLDAINKRIEELENQPVESS